MVNQIYYSDFPVHVYDDGVETRLSLAQERKDQEKWGEAKKGNEKAMKSEKQG